MNKSSWSDATHCIRIAPTETRVVGLPLGDLLSQVSAVVNEIQKKGDCRYPDVEDIVIDIKKCEARIYYTTLYGAPHPSSLLSVVAK